jgi:colicin import membrane protein
VTAGDDFDDERFREDPPAAISLSDLPDDEPGANASSKHSSEHGEFDEFIVHGENEVDVVERGESQSSTICVEEGNLKSGPQEEHEQQADEVVEKQVKKTNRGRKQSAEELRASEGDVDDTEMEKEESDKESSAKKTEKRVSPRRLDKKIEEARPKSKTSSPEMEAEKDRSQSSVQLNEVSKEIDFWVEIDNSQTKRKRSQSNDDSESDKEEEDELEEEVVEEKTSKKRPQGKAAKRVPLKEKSSNVKQATTSKKQEKKPAAKVAKNETKKVTKKEVKKETKKTTKQEGKVEKGGSSTRSGLRRDSQPESPPKLTSRQKTIKATAEEPRSHSGLNLPKRFELHCKKALNACVDDERRWKATNDLLMMVDTLE